MKTEEWEEKASLYAVGALNKQEAENFETEWEKRKQENPEFTDQFVSFSGIMPLISAAVSEKRIPAESVKTKLMSRLKEKPVKPLQQIPDGFKILFGADHQWNSFDAIPGIQYKNLAINSDRGYVTTLVKMAPGAVLDEHYHMSSEECYVLSGDLIAFGRKLGPGDFIHADAGTDHEPLRSEMGCLALLVYDPVDLLPTRVKKSRIMKPILEHLFS